MLASVVQIGNSHGVRLPKRILNELDIKDKVELIVKKNELIIKGVKKRPRQDWDDAFAKKTLNKENKLLLPENIDNDAFEWIW
jgi:antitoxin MazE